MPEVARFSTVDPICDGSNWFAYCGNEPVNFRDAWGLSASDKGKPTPTEGVASLDSTPIPVIPSTTDLIREALENNLGQPYAPGNTCDEYVDDSFTDAGVDTSGIFAGPTDPTTVAEHIAEAERNGTATDEPGQGASAVFMDDSPPPNNYTPHAGAIIVNNDDSVDYYDSSSNNPDSVSTHWEYDNVEAFEDDYGYNGFHYIGAE